MPHEKINFPRFDSSKDQLVAAWNEIGWVTVSIYPEGWSSTGDADHVELNPQELDLLIKTLQRAKRQAYGKGNRHTGFEDSGPVSARPLFTP